MQLVNIGVWLARIAHYIGTMRTNSSAFLAWASSGTQVIVRDRRSLSLSLFHRIMTYHRQALCYAYHVRHVTKEAPISLVSHDVPTQHGDTRKDPLAAMSLSDDRCPQAPLDSLLEQTKVPDTEAMDVEPMDIQTIEMGPQRFGGGRMASGLEDLFGSALSLTTTETGSHGAVQDSSTSKKQSLIVLGMVLGAAVVTGVLAIVIAIQGHMPWKRGLDARLGST